MIYLTALLTGILGTYAGADGTSKAWRRLGIPILLSIFTQNAWYLLLFAPLCIGYGRFDISDDRPSTIGKFVHKITQKPLYEDILIRLIVSICVFSVLLPLAIQIHSIPRFCGLGAIYVAVEVLFGAIIKGEGEISVFGHHYLLEEFIRFAILGACAFGLTL